MKFDIHDKDIKNLHFDDWIFKICSHVNFLVGVIANAKTKFIAKFLTKCGLHETNGVNP